MDQNNMNFILWRKMMKETFALPIFILSCERSGSTMLRYIMDTHSKIACPGHLYLGSLCEGLNRTLFGTLAQTHGERDEESKRQYALSETRSMVVNIMQRYTTAKGKQIWCEKTPMNLEYLSVLEAHFPDAKYICLYRNCMDVVNSSLNMSKFRFLPEHMPYVHRNPENIIAAMTENWLEKTGRLLEFEAAHPERCYRVKYESVVTQFEETLEPLFEFLGVGWEAGLSERVFSVAHDAGEGDGKATLSSKIRQDSVGRGKEVPRSGIPNKFLPALDDLLSKLGYLTIDAYYSQNNLPVASSKKKCETSKFSEISEIFDVRFMNAVKRNRHLYPTLQGIWKVIVTGVPNGVWTIDLSGQEGVIKSGDSKADFSLSLSAALLIDIMNGKRSSVEAINQGVIEITGVNDNGALTNLGRLLFS
ncbi:sulfotransferase [Methylobacter sp. S3L5C]|uniref:sulfotransferase n=1 Tax=Methylobacter sp. S3L5C TaxID=2839024 RepID=UPI001FAE6131|nr:sulfotransferase [Methylobacter sp. S3L5C]UOA09642.1 sulfotransferase [Methylobacter sp. S3L5C]